MVRVVGKEEALGAGVGGNCSSGMDGSRKICDNKIINKFTMQIRHAVSPPHIQETCHPGHTPSASVAQTCSTQSVE